ncbi:unnamed protein product, partial [Vitis vinifera]
MASTGPSQSLKRPDSSLTRGDQLIITPLGAGNEVGRSCVYMSYKGKTILFDCGIHPAYSVMAALPYFDEIDPSTIDVLLVTQFDWDQLQVLHPHLLLSISGAIRSTADIFLNCIRGITLYKGRWPLQVPFLGFWRDERVNGPTHSLHKVSIHKLEHVLSYVRVIDFHQTLEVNGIRFWCYTAGHVLGAAMFMVDIAGVRVLYTGDYSSEEDRHLRAAEIPQFCPDICIIESTYGVQLHQPRHVREKRFTDVIHSTISQGGRVLIPAYALGRAQELLLILDEYWSNHPELHNIPYFMLPPLQKGAWLFTRHISIP